MTKLANPWKNIIEPTRVGYDGNDPHKTHVNNWMNEPSAAFQIDADDSGFLPPRLTTAQRDGIILPSPGLLIFNTDFHAHEYFDGKSWNVVGQNGTRIGQVATRCYVPNSFYNGNNEAMWRTSHYARDHITSIKLAFANWYVYADNNGQELPGGSATLHVSVEYPAGTFTRITFDGNNSGAVDAGATAYSDMVKLTTPIPNGALFWVRTHYASASGVLFNGALNGNTYTPFGEGGMYGTSTPDLTIGGTVGNMGVQNGYAPCLILSQTNRPAVAVIGDSRACGVADTMDRSGDAGEIARSIGPALPYTNLGISGDRAQWFLASHTKRLALADYCTHAVVEYGINDLGAGRTSGELLGDLNAIAALFPSKPVWQTTMTPVSMSSDNWQSVAGQTTSALNAQRVAANDSIRAMQMSNVTGHFDVADTVETARNSGIWLPWHTSDGLHANQIGNLKIRASGAINPVMFQ